MITIMTITILPLKFLALYYTMLYCTAAVPVVGGVGQQRGHVEHDLAPLELAVHAVQTRAVVCKYNI